MNTNAVESYYRNTLHWYATSQSASQLVSSFEWDKQMNYVEEYCARNEEPATALWTNEKNDNSEEEKQRKKENSEQWTSSNVILFHPSSLKWIYRAF